jgi:hypothetical protein
VLNGTAKYSTGFTPTTTPLSVSTTNQTLLTCYSNRFIDSNTATTAKTITTTGTPQVSGYWYPSTFTAPTASPGAGYFDGTADYLSVANTAALQLTGDFTIEFWVYISATSASNSVILSKWNVSSQGYIIFYDTSKRINFQTTAVPSLISSTTTPLASFNHIAAVRNGNVYTLYINGTSVGTSTSATTATDSGTALNIARNSDNLINFTNGYVSNIRIVKGTPVYTGNFTPPTLAFLQTSGAASAACYPSTTNVNTSFAAANTSLLVNLADSNFVSATNGVQNNTFIDNSNYAFPITRTGTPTQGSVTPYWPNGYWGNYFSGASGVYLNTVANAAFSFGTSNFTVEGWVFPTGTLVSNNMPIVEIRTTSGATGFVFLRTANALTLNVYTNNAFGGVSTNSLTLNAWNHVALVRSTNTWSYYINGVASGSFTNTSSQTDGATTGPKIGGSNSAAAEVWVGYLSNIRIVKGVAVYTGAFTPPTSPLAATQSAGTNISAITGTATSLLTCQSNRFVDNSTNNFAITVNSTPRVQAFQPFSPVASYTPAAYGGSGYFNGTSDGLSVTNNASAFTFTGDFTIETWFYIRSITVTGGASPVIASGTNSANNWLIYIQTGNFYFAWNGSNVLVSSSITIPLNAWSHLALVRSGSSVTFYLNGVGIGSATSSSSFTLNNSVLYVGQSTATGGFLDGYLSNLRIVKGVAAYSGAFTPPTLAPLTAAGSTSAASYSSTTNVNTVFPSSSTSLLTNFSNAGIYDAAVQNDAITVGDAQGSTTQYKWSPTSMKFDGTGDWLTAIDGPQLQLGTGDFTIDGWFYLAANGVAYGLVSKGTASTGWSVNVTSGNRLQFSYTASNLTGATTTLAAATWYYFAVVRSGSATGNLKIYINGSVEATSGGAVTDSFTQTDILYVGASRTGTTPLNGYLQDVRITKYARTITTPTAAFPTR